MSKPVDATVRTRSLRGGHYRAGRKHEAEPGDFPPGTFTEVQLAQLRADPDLEVQMLEAPQAQPLRKKKPAAAAPDAEAAGETEPGQDETAGGEAPAGDEDFTFEEGQAEAPEASPVPEAAQAPQAKDK
jgi:hypothetical protein